MWSVCDQCIPQEPVEGQAAWPTWRFEQSCPIILALRCPPKRHSFSEDHFEKLLWNNALWDSKVQKPHCEATGLASQLPLPAHPGGDQLPERQSDQAGSPAAPGKPIFRTARRMATDIASIDQQPVLRACQLLRQWSLTHRTRGCRRDYTPSQKWLD